jgi:D-glycero-beta-D-manno-heptose 1-phosphate adenylyltransferase
MQEKQKSKLSIIKDKIYTENQASLIQKFQGTTVFTNGCFDILHEGHVTYLAKAADFGDKLIIGMNDDASVKAQGKGDLRPINPENSRALLLAALDFVSAVVIFGDDTPLDIIKAIKPHVLVKGGDYNAEQTDETKKDYIVGSKFVLANGGTVKTVNLVDGFSTTSIIKKINNE